MKMVPDILQSPVGAWPVRLEGRGETAGPRKFGWSVTLRCVVQVGREGEMYAG